MMTMSSYLIESVFKMPEILETEVPISKSISNRILIINHLAGENNALPHLSQALDTRELQSSLAPIRQCLGEGTSIYAGEGGTGVRFLIALLSITPGSWKLHCRGSMLHRPVLPLVNALTVAGADITQITGETFPLLINGKSLSPLKLVVDNSLSSQFVSALLLIAPYLGSDTTIKLLHKPPSLPYINMTAELMRRCGVSVSKNGMDYCVSKGSYHIPPLKAEGDWSAAAFWFALMAIKRVGKCVIKPLQLSSIQGDRYCVELFGKLGIETTEVDNGVMITAAGNPPDYVDADFSNHPDLSIPFIVACAALKTHARFTGLESLKHKESNRLEAIRAALSQCRVPFRLDGNDSLRVFPSELFHSPEIKVANDHRMAMSFALLAACGCRPVLDNIICTEKSYPSFWKEFSKAGFEIKSVV
jgi:3-phosphoshikimate 1-carboxyvinyltransferase